MGNGGWCLRTSLLYCPRFLNFYEIIDHNSWETAHLRCDNHPVSVHDESTS